MPQPHITRETFKGLTPEEQEKYGEEIPQVQPLIIYPDEDWRDLKPGETVENMNQLGRKTRIIHYLKPVEAKQSEAENPSDVAFKYVKQYGLPDKAAVPIAKAYAKGHRKASDTLYSDLQERITALQQEVERLKEAQSWVPVSERLPETPDDFYLVSVKNKNKEDGIFLIDIAVFDSDGKWIQSNTWETITHWQPLPPPPTN